ncbi:MAG: ATP-binding protein [Blastocatellia bacterium]|nr:ATP-binding protein [Blastocatellia bacterium]
MSITDKPLDAVNEADFQSIIGSERETKTMEFKVSLPGNSDSDKKEFLYDVSSFANASGGHVFYGVKEENGIAAELPGLQIDNPDATVLRLEELIRAGIELRIPGIQIKPIPLRDNKTAIVIRIPQSWALPHRVRLGGSSRFYSRNSAGKYELDVSELRSLFVLSETRAEKLRNFRVERLSRIIADETPALLEQRAKVILHALPIGAFDSSANIDLTRITNIWNNDASLLAPLHSSSINGPRYNFDGVFTFSRTQEASNSYLQIFRNGSVETVNASLLREWEGRKQIPSIALEESLLRSSKRILALQKFLAVSSPVFLMLTLLGVKGYTMAVNANWDSEGHAIDRDILVVSEVLLEKFEADIDSTMRPLFDAVWNATGWSRSMSYDQNGKWSPQR